jgi:signal transduction histidine kinase
MAFGAAAALDDEGNCAVDSSAQQTKDAQFAERLRVQELLRYADRGFWYRDELMRTRYFKPYDGPGPGEGKARVATDTALTAFAQLSALRLNCQRSFISLMTDSKQYIVAEATRTISLKSEDVYDGADDAIFLGQSILDFEWGVCPGTIACFTSTDGSLDISAPYVKASRSYYVMNDMSVLEHYKDRPYIAGWPYMKYYAEVPIHSPSGLTIGTLCVVDNTAREGLDLKGLAILREISESIMNHLELCTSRIQRNNAERMIQALGKFVEGKESVREWWIEAQASRGVEPGLRHLSVEKRADIELGSIKEVNPAIDSVSGIFDDAILQIGPDHTAQLFETLKSRPARYFDPELSSQHGSSTPEAQAQSDGSLDKSIKGVSPSTTFTSPDPIRSLSETPGGEKRKPPAGDQFPFQPLSDLEKMLFRATNLIREGIGLDGIVLFDPRSTDGQLLMDVNLSGEKVLWSDRCSSKSPATKAESSSYFSPYDPPSQTDKYCQVLASSTRRRSNRGAPVGEPLEVPESLLQHLLQCFPGGGIFNYDKKGFIGGHDSVFSHPSGTPNSDVKSGSKSRTDGVTREDSSWEANKLQSILPDVTSVLLLPLWDANHDKWFAYCMAWTTNPTRIFERQDFTYLASFGNSIMTEISRLETVAADNAKSAFISSISHELRSPLHGIMASVELLRDINSEPVSNDIVDTVESCGSTLLDTIENLLTFSKANRLAARTESLHERRLPTIDLGALVEDVTQMLIAGHRFRQTVEISDVTYQGDHDSRKIDIKIPAGLTVLCDISPACDFVFKTDAGVWKRILMNLLGNSLKYTSSGYILVKLRLEDNSSATANGARLATSVMQSNSMIDPNLPLVSSAVIEGPPMKTQSSTVKEDTKTFNVVLTIEDSGKGMSQDYLTHHLFKPFYQEDSLSPGTGLGLSIVYQLVSSIAGSINITSELGSGTEVRVDAALERPDLTTTPRSAQSSDFQNLRLGLCGLDVVPDLAETPSGVLDMAARRSLALHSILADYATSLGLSTITVDSLESDAVDIMIVTESEHRRICSSHMPSSNRPLIVLATEPTLRYGQISPELSFTAVVLSQP